MKKGWEVKSLGQVCKFQNGFAFKSKSYKDIGVPVIRITNIKKDKVELKNAVHVCLDEYSRDLSKYKIEKGDILIAMSGATTGKIGKYCYDDFALLNQRVGKFEPKDKILNDFFYYFLNTKIEESLNISQGSAQPNLSTEQIKNFKIPLPPLAEQKAIVAKLDQVFKAIDQAKANIEQNMVNAEELFQSQLNQIFSQTGKGWEEKKLGEVCENLDNKRKPITKSKRTPGEIPYYGASGIVDYVEGFLFDEDLLLVSEDGANLVARKYPIAFSISGKSWVNNHAHVLRFDNLYSQKFIEFYLNSISLDPYISGMAQPKMNQKKLNSIPVPSPDLSIQKDVVNQIQKLTNSLNSIKQKNQQKLESLEELRQSILEKAFQGELVSK